MPVSFLNLGDYYDSLHCRAAVINNKISWIYTQVSEVLQRLVSSDLEKIVQTPILEPSTVHTQNKIKST